MAINGINYFVYVNGTGSKFINFGAILEMPLSRTIVAPVSTPWRSIAESGISIPFVWTMLDYDVLHLMFYILGNAISFLEAAWHYCFCGNCSRVLFGLLLLLALKSNSFAHYLVYEYMN